MLRVVVKLFTSHDLHSWCNGALLKTLLRNHLNGLHNLFLDLLQNQNFRNFLNDNLGLEPKWLGFEKRRRHLVLLLRADH